MYLSISYLILVRLEYEKSVFYNWLFLGESKSSKDEEESEDNGDIMPTGYVVGITQRNWREYVAAFAQDEVYFNINYKKKKGKTVLSPTILQ